jgi:hypothetical protein
MHRSAIKPTFLATVAVYFDYDEPKSRFLRREKSMRNSWIAFIIIGGFTAIAVDSGFSEAAPGDGFHYINSSFENASPLYWERGGDGAVHIYLVYDSERDSPNRANGHWLFQAQAEKGSELTFTLHNFDNVWNGKHGAPVSKKTICYTSPDGRSWTAIPTELLEGDAIRIQVKMESDSLYLARLEPYRISDLDHFLAEINRSPLVDIEKIGRTVEGRELEIVRAGNPGAPYCVLLRARSHPWEPGGNWVVQGLVRRLLMDDEIAKRYRERFCVYVLPMANKDGVARGRTRFNSLGVDLNRKWDQPADPQNAPENFALESWLQMMIERGKRPHLAIDFHNDEGGNLHLSFPGADAERYRKRMKRLEDLMRAHSWYTEGSVGGGVSEPATFGDGLLNRFGIDAVVQELNCNWIAGLNKVPSARDWELLGEQYLEIFYRYFDGWESL